MNPALLAASGQMPKIPPDLIGWAILALILYFPLRGLLRLLGIWK